MGILSNSLMRVLAHVNTCSVGTATHVHEHYCSNSPEYLRTSLTASLQKRLGLKTSKGPSWTQSTEQVFNEYLFTPMEIAKVTNPSPHSSQTCLLLSKQYTQLPLGTRATRTSRKACLLISIFPAHCKVVFGVVGSTGALELNKPVFTS